MQSRLAVFRMPNECGPLNEISLMENNHSNIWRTMTEGLTYVRGFSMNDFGFSLSSEAQLALKELTEELDRQIKTNLTQFGTELTEFVNG